MILEIWSMTGNLLLFCDIFCPKLYPTNNPKNQYLEKMKTCLERLFFYAWVPWMTFTSCMVLEIWSTTGRIFCHFGPFLPFYPTNNSENKMFEKSNKHLEICIIILKMWTINNNHIMYVSRDMESNEHNFLSFWIIFDPFNPLTTRKIKILKKWKKCLEISSYCPSNEMRKSGDFLIALFQKKKKRNKDQWFSHLNKILASLMITL